MGLRRVNALLARLGGRTRLATLCQNRKAASARTGDPRNPMDRTAEARMWNLVKDQRVARLRMLNVVSAFAGLHTCCYSRRILQ